MKKILLFITLLSLSACSYFKDEPVVVARPILEISQPKPLDLYPVQWQIMVIENVPYYTVTEQNFKNLAKNAELTQNRIILNEKTIFEMNNYYNFKK